MMAKEYIDRIDFIYLFYLSFYVKRYFQWGFVQLQTTDGIFILPIQCSSDFSIVTAAMDNVLKGVNNPLPVGRQIGSTSQISFTMQTLSEISVICICKA